MQSLERGLAVIRAFDSERRSLTLSDVARETGLSRASARRFLHTLVELGYVATDGREFTLRPQLLELGYAYLSSLTLPDIAAPHLEELSQKVSESSSVAVLDGTDIVYVARVATHRIMSASIRVGTRFPAYATSMGRAILAHAEPGVLDAYLASAVQSSPPSSPPSSLPLSPPSKVGSTAGSKVGPSAASKTPSGMLVPLTSRTITDPRDLRAALDLVREQGWALVDQELEEGLRSVAAPLRDGTGRVVAAVNVSAPVRRGEIATLVQHLLPPLLKAAAAIEADLARMR
ncbi:IclR family transcriptional regulator C-terminal domain-containing protein [Promicromonospora sp. AC04]|uniref:IclR family transcriptional regulator domain-containing protein n=1 Tax=Promicromonospora sp. AC04 TaxID=2135723 RepID=UPI001E428200|nr:IclR family transcriptional regulator C-terminal domain-containing protein [Promicromonospora sp. AC04]